MPESAPSPTPERPRSKAVAVLGWILPVVLAGAAIALQLKLDVPTSEMIPRPDKEAEKAKKRRAQARKRKQKADRARQSRIWRARSPTRIARLRESWTPRPLVDEPVDPNFRRHHDALLRAVVSFARREAIGSKAVVIRTMPGCRTIRCSLELCGPTSSIDAIAEQLPKVELSEGPLWHTFEEEEPTRTPGEPSPVVGSKDPLEPNICRRWLVSFADDAPQRSALRIPGSELTPEPDQPPPDPTVGGANPPGPVPALERRRRP